MQDVLIRECTVHVVRHGGWSWGPSPKQLLAAIIEELPRLIERRLAELLPDDAEGIVREPVVVRVPFCFSELIPAEADGVVSSRVAAALRARVEGPLEAALAAALEHMAPASTDTPHPLQSAVLVPDMENRRSLDLFLLRMLAEGTLAAFLERLPLAALRKLHAAGHARRPREEDLTAAVLLRRLSGATVAALEEISKSLPRAASEHSRLAGEIGLAAALASRTGLLPSDEEIATAVLCLRLSDSPGSSGIHAHSDAPLPPSREVTPATAAATAVRAATAPAATLSAPMPPDVRFSSALPWLTLVPLERSGLLEAVAALFEAARMEASLPTFAAAYAARLLPIEEPRWKHQEQRNAALSAFGGNLRPIPEEEIADLPRKSAEILPALWLALQTALVKGRQPHAPLALLKTGRGIVVADPGEGAMFAASRTAAGLLPALTLAEAPLVASRDCAAEARELAGIGVTGVSTTGPFEDPEFETIAENCAHFIGACTPVPRAEDFSFEAWLAALCMTALRALDAVRQPLEILDYYRGFDALAHFRDGSVRLRLPLGRRYLDLDREGWLRPLRQVPWMEGRVIEFSGG